MKKLSEISDDTELMVFRDKYYYDEPLVMSKSELLSSEYLSQDSRVYVACKDFAKFDLYDTIEFIGEDMYDDWYSLILEDLASMKDEIKDFTAKINEVLKGRPAYYDGEEVNIDE